MFYKTTVFEFCGTDIKICTSPNCITKLVEFFLGGGGEGVVGVWNQKKKINSFTCLKYFWLCFCVLSPFLFLTSPYLHTSCNLADFFAIQSCYAAFYFLKKLEIKYINVSNYNDNEIIVSCPWMNPLLIIYICAAMHDVMTLLNGIWGKLQSLLWSCYLK